MKKDDPMVTLALALAVEICPECVCCDKKDFTHGEAPCPFFHPRNFYYDSKHKRFWCRNWLGEDGSTEPRAKCCPA